VLGPTDVFEHKILSENVAVMSSFRSIIFLILAMYAWATHETILLVCLGDLQKIMPAINELLDMSVSFVFRK